MNDADKKNGPTGTETLFGGVEVKVRFDAPEHAVNFEVVHVKQLKVKDCPQLMAAQGDEIETVMIYTGKPREWVEKLWTESHELIIQEGERLNADFFGRWVQRRLATSERLVPGALGKLQERVMQPVRSDSANGSQKSAASAA